MINTGGEPKTTEVYRGIILLWGPRLRYSDEPITKMKSFIPAIFRRSANLQVSTGFILTE